MAQKFVRFLSSQGIESAAEKGMENQCQVWVVREEDVERAQSALENYRANPNDSTFDIQVPQAGPLKDLGPSSLQAAPIRSRISYRPLTLFLAALASILFLVQQWQESEVARPFTEAQLEHVALITPIEEALLIQTPEPLVKLKHVVEERGPTAAPLSVPQVEEILSEAPEFVGAWGSIQEALNLAPQRKPAPFLPEVRAGQLWRLLTPALLHGHLLHIGFNLLWLFYLGRHIEQRLGSLRMLGIVLVAALISNVSQYAMSGPLFYGLSGVICGLGGFIWSRQRIAPWEGYPVPQATLQFLAAFVLVMIVVECGIFAAELVHGPLGLGFGIANTAHVTGGLAGILLGRLPCMGKRSKL